MPKAERGTPKDLANRMKAKGLQKLRWFCQMCQKQCRDENGFKCHTMSESHQRQLLLFADNPNKYLDEFSKEFTTGFVDLLKRRFSTKRVYANQVYQEYISDRNHLHMNATRWLSLTAYVKWLGRQGICTVDETEKGWYITWIDRDPDTLAREAAEMKKKKMDKDDEDRLHDFIEKQIVKAKVGQEEKVVEYTGLQRKSEDEKVVENLFVKPVAKVQPIASSSSVFKDLKRKDDDLMSLKSFRSSTSSKSSEKRKLSALEEIKIEEERRKQRMKRENSFKQEPKGQDYLKQESKGRPQLPWLSEGIVVKVVTKDLGDKYYKKKGVVVKIVDDYVAVVKLLETESKLKLDQCHLETVIPAVGREMKILKGRYEGCIGKLVRINEDKYCVDVEILGGSYDGKLARDLPYEDVSKLHPRD